MKAKIRKNTKVFQDFSWGVWEETDEHIVFNVEKKDDWYMCTAFGFGDLESKKEGAYGNGHIVVFERKDLIFIRKPVKPKESPKEELTQEEKNFNKEIGGFDILCDTKEASDTLYRYEICPRYSHEITLRKYRILKETECSYFYIKGSKRTCVRKNAARSFAHKTKKKALEQFIRRTKHRVFWAQLSAVITSKALEKAGEKYEELYGKEIEHSEFELNPYNFYMDRLY